MANGIYKSLSFKTASADAFDALADESGLTKSVLLTKLVKLGRARIRELLMIDVPPPGAHEPSSCGASHLPDVRAAG